jgi:hypothetical protein
MILSWLRPRRQTHRRPQTFRPMLEALDHKIVPANAHFVAGGTASSIDPTTGVLTVTFHEAGLGNNQEVVATLTGEAHAVYQWFNHGGNRPMGQPFYVNETFSLTGTFTSDDNGQIQGTFSVSPPGVDAFFATNHAANWVPKLTISYTDVGIQDVTNGVSTFDEGFDLDQATAIQIQL